MKNRCFLLLLSALLLFGMVPVSVSAAVETAFYVDSLNGSDEGSGTIDAPFATLRRAQEAVRGANEAMTGDIAVYLREGTHRLTEPLQFTEADGGTNGHYVRYQSYPGESAVISGGKELTFQASADNLWEASVPEGIEYVLSLDINGRPARRAQNETPGRILHPYGDEPAPVYGTDGVTITGYTYDADGFYAKAADLPVEAGDVANIQLQIAYMWITGVYNVDAIEANPEDASEVIVKISHQIQADAQNMWQQIADPVNWGFTLYNARSVLDHPGEFYFDRAAKKLYYYPREGESLDAVVAEVPAVEELVHIEGSSVHSKAKNISFSGLSFMHATWWDQLRYGFRIGQTQEFYTQPEQLLYDDYVGKFFMPAAVQLQMTEGIIFENNVFRALDCVGIGLYQGAYNTKINGNTFYELGDSAVTVGMPNQAYESTVVEGYNLAEGKPATASGSSYNIQQRYFTYLGPEAAVDPNQKVGWAARDAGSVRPWWQVDLLDAYEIDRIEIDARKGTEQTPTRRYFEVLASNDPTFAEGSYVVLGTQHSNGTNSAKPEETETFPHEGTWAVDVTDVTPYRYVRIRKTVTEYLWLNEVRVINKSMAFTPKWQLSRHTEVTNNCITRVSEHNWAAPGIHSYFTEDLLIAHNDISEQPYSGICAGWGWNNYPDMTHCREIKIQNNRIESVMNRLLDGGGIYTLGPQPDSVISGNYIADLGNPISGVYLDSGSDFFTVENNVMENVHFSNTGGGGTGRTNHIRGNYSSVMDGSIANLLSESEFGTLETPTYFIEGDYPAGAIDIIQNAGLTSGWRHLKAEVPAAADELADWTYSDNVINVTLYGSMHDARFYQWHVDYLQRHCESVILPLVQAKTGDGLLQYPQTAVEAYAAAVAEAKAAVEGWRAALSGVTLSEELVIDREEVLAVRAKLQAAAEALANSLQLRPLSELIPLANAAAPGSELQQMADQAREARARGDELIMRTLQLEMEQALENPPYVMSVSYKSAAENGETVTEPTAGTGYWVHVDFTNNDETISYPLMVTVALYKDNRLMQVDTESMDIAAGSPQTVKAGLTMPADLEGYQVKALIWNRETMVPLWPKGESQ